MSNTHPAQILDAIESILKSVTELRKSIFRGRTYSKEVQTCISIYMGQMDPTQLSQSLTDETLQVRIMITVQAHEQNLDDQTLDTYNRCLIALMADRTLGLSFVHDIEPGGFGEPLILDGSAKPIQQTEALFTVTFRHNTNDIGAL